MVNDDDDKKSSFFFALYQLSGARQRPKERERCVFYCEAFFSLLFYDSLVWSFKKGVSRVLIKGFVLRRDLVELYT